MSFLGGAECSTSNNALSQFSKHTQSDQSLLRERTVGGVANQFSKGFRSGPEFDARQEAEFQAFANSRAPAELVQPLPGLHIDPATTLHLRAKPAVIIDGQAAMERAFSAPPGTQFNTEDVMRFRQMENIRLGALASQSARSSPMPVAVSPPPMQLRQQQQQMFSGSSSQSMGMGMGMGMMGRQMGSYQPMFTPQTTYAAQQQQQQHDIERAQLMERIKQLELQQGKGKEVEVSAAKWDAVFDNVERTVKASEQAEKGKQQAIDDEPVLETSEAFLKEMDQIDEQLLEGGPETNFGDFESIWRGIQEEQGNTTARARNWLDWAGEVDGWEDMQNPFSATAREREPYLFDEENLFEGVENPFDEGMRIMREGGNLSLAALAFEAAVMKDKYHVEAWVQLGSAQAQNEKETAAIRALEHALAIDPNNLAALMGLAVSYINEGYDATAYRTLERWLSAKYPAIVPAQLVSEPAQVGVTAREGLHERVTDRFIRAAQLSPDGSGMDPDVQVGLGVLFYGSEEFEKAVDCFKSALDSSALGISNQSSQLHLLWNRLGATLANSGRPEDAIAAYEKALTLQPNFVRARYNLGVSCINMGCHDEAAQNLLSALASHAAVEREGREHAKRILGHNRAQGAAPISDDELNKIMGHNRSTTLYDTLRRVFTLMDRKDLAAKVVTGVDPEVFRSDIDF